MTTKITTTPTPLAVVDKINEIIDDATNLSTTVENKLDKTGTAASATKLATERTIDGISFNGAADINHYVVCETAAEIADKTVSHTGFKLVNGASIRVRFINNNTADSPTLNVNSTGAKGIYYNGYAIKGYQLIGSYTVYDFVYDGTFWRLLGGTKMLGATADAAGKVGLVPAPAAGKQTSFLRGDGTWAAVPNTAKKFYGPTNLSSGNFTASYDGFLIAVDSSSGDGRNIKVYNNSVLMASHYDHHSSQAFGITPFKSGDVLSVTGPNSLKYYKMELR